MAKPKADTKRHTKNTVSTSAMFKSFKPTKPMFKEFVKGFQELEKRNQGKLAIEKASKVTKPKQPKVKQRPVHSLAAAFSDATEESRDHVLAKVNANIEATQKLLGMRIDESNDRFSQLEQDAIKFNEALAHPFKDTELEWTCADNSRTGKTLLGIRMKKFQKTIDFEEKELAGHFDEWNTVQDELTEFLVELVGPDRLKGFEAGDAYAKDFVSEEQRKMREELEAEKKKYLDEIEEASKIGMKQMKESEKKLQLKQKKAEDHFLAIFREDEY